MEGNQSLAAASTKRFKRISLLSLDEKQNAKLAMTPIDQIRNATCATVKYTSTFSCVLRVDTPEEKSSLNLTNQLTCLDRSLLY